MTAIPYDFGPERKVLTELATAVKTTGRFPRFDEFRTEENHELLDRTTANGGEPPLVVAADGLEEEWAAQ
jgi:hypothetical protein